MQEKISELLVTAYTVPTEETESDGTLEWSSTTAVVARARAGDAWGLGWSYTAAAAARLIDDVLRPKVLGADPLEVRRTWTEMVASVRNAGRPGLASTAIAAVDVALWDLKAHLLEVPMTVALDACRDSVELYGSGGFTSLTDRGLERQLGDWVAGGLGQVKMKVGREPSRDLERTARARKAIGPQTGLFVDANGAYTVRQALALAEGFAELDVSWFEEPVSSDDLEGLRRIRERAPGRIEVAAGEYGYDSLYFRRMLAAGAVDVLQADCTRCLGFTGFLQADALAQAFHTPLSAHCAPSLHAQVGCAAAMLRHVEYFHDHARLEPMLFDGVLAPRDGRLWPDPSRPGLGMRLKVEDAARFKVYG